MLPSLIATTLALVVSVAQIAQIAAGDTNELLSWTIYHSWNPNQEFVRRGSLTWGPKEDDPSKKVFQIINDDESSKLNSKDIKDMLEYGWYHVKIQGQAEDTFVFQTVPACNLRRANFKDQFDITLPRSSTGNKQDPVTSFAYTPLVSPLAPKTCGEYDDDKSDDETKSFSSRVSVQLDTPAMSLKTVLPQNKPPPGIAFIKQPVGGGGAQPGGGGESHDGGELPQDLPSPSPMTFFSKYWYIILPILILQFLQAPEELPPQGQGQHHQQQQGGQVAGGAGGATTKARRGKTNK